MLCEGVGDFASTAGTIAYLKVCDGERNGSHYSDIARRGQTRTKLDGPVHLLPGSVT